MDNAAPTNRLSDSILRTLAYYDLFDYPLTAEEIFRRLPTNHVTPEEVETEASSLRDKSVIYRFGSYYSLQNKPSLEGRRNAGNDMANVFLKIAERKSRLIAQFPFVRSVMISGSLSKGYADENSDIDFFIVTQPGRLWIARTLLVLYKRIFLFNSHKYFCVNYFVDTEHLEIEEKNLFTATELATLIPLYGEGYHADLLKKNHWLHSFFPNFRAADTVLTPVKSFAKRALEWIFNHFFPNALDRSLMAFSLNRWEKIYRSELPAEDFKIAFKTTRHVSKCHPNHYQRKILARYREKIEDFGLRATIA